MCGFIGLELAATFRLSGAEVALIEVLSRILMRGVPEQIAALLHRTPSSVARTMAG